jgi:pimeloyl-ACP methyl ester carboxylesterase
MFVFIHAVRIALVFLLALASVAPASASPFGTAPVKVDSFDSGTLHVDTYGHGPKSIILIPGLASGPWVWYGTIDYLTAGSGADKYTIYALTLPGFDGQPATKKTPLVDTFSADFWALLDAKKIVKPVIVGHSLGGTLAIALAEQHPERIAGIVAVDGLPVFPMLASATADKRQDMATQMSSMYASMNTAQVLAAEKKYMASVGTNKPELVDPTAQLMAKSDPKAVGAWAQADIQDDLRPGLVKVTIPFVEIMPFDPTPPQQYTQDQLQQFYQHLIIDAPKATVVAIGPSKHFAMLDQPDAFYADLTRFLGTLPQ